MADKNLIPTVDTFNTSLMCYEALKTTTRGVWAGENPLDYSLPLFITQMTIVVLTTRFFLLLFKPIHQPILIAEVMGGLLLGPSGIGGAKTLGQTVFPVRSAIVIETMANIGLLYFLFLMGLEMDISYIKQIGKKSVSLAVGSMILPFMVGVGFALMVYDKDKHLNKASYVLYLGLACSVSAYPVIARLLTELKLINTEIGKLALSTSMISDICAWGFLAVAIASSRSTVNSRASVLVIISSATFVAFCIFVVRPAITWMISTNEDGEPFSEVQISLILCGVMVSGFVTDALGTHVIFGAYVYGLIIPNGPLAATIIEKLEDFVSGLLLPLYFTISGLKTDIYAIGGPKTWIIGILVISLACLGKITGTLVVSFLYQIPAREGVTLGLLMNTKGLIEMIVLNVGREEKVLDEKVFSLMVIVTIIMTAITSPIVALVYRPRKGLIAYKRRTMQNSRLDAELRVLVCVHVPRNVPTIINLLDTTYPTKKSPLCVFVVHLVELTGRASAMLIVHANHESGRPALNRTQAQTDHIITAFQNFEKYVECVSVQPVTAISPYPTMHQDIWNLAEEKRVSIIIIPFHMQHTVDGEMLETNPAYRIVNHNLLQNPPCSVGILVDRGLNGSTLRLTANHSSHQVAVLFFGGPDDREALSYGWRMSLHSRVNLTVIHFVPGRDVIESMKHDDDADDDQGSSSNPIMSKLDEEFINDFKRNCADDDTIVYVEKVVNDGEETVEAIRSVDDGNDLFIVGRDQGMASILTEGITDWSDCPELGPIGDLLASSDFETSASVLVMCQYVELGPEGENIVVSERPWHQSTDHHRPQKTKFMSRCNTSSKPPTSCL